MCERVWYMQGWFNVLTFAILNEKYHFVKARSINFTAIDMSTWLPVVVAVSLAMLGYNNTS